MASCLLLRRCPGLLTKNPGASATAVAAATGLRRGLSLGGMQPPPLPAEGGRPTGPATAATGSREGLGHFGGAKADYDEKYPQGPGQPAPNEVSAFGRPDPDAQQRARTDVILTPHGYRPVRTPSDV